MTGGYVCPACRSPVARKGEAWACGACGRSYPVLFGIADFRLAPDPYLSLTDERAKAGHLHAFAQDHGFAETVAEYYRITEDVPPDMAVRFAAYVQGGEMRGRAILPALGPGGGALLDAGCGAGGLVAAAARQGRAVTGLDIALRWLVIAQKRLSEAGLSAELVCADIASPPFADARFGAIAAIDLFEHVPDQAACARSLFGLLGDGGRLFAAGANRFTIARYPLAGMWGVGFLPRPLRRRYVLWRRGLDTLRHTAPIWPAGLKRTLAQAGFTPLRVSPRAYPADSLSTAGRVHEFAVRTYGLMRRAPLLRDMLTAIGPAFEIEVEKAPVR